MYAAPKHKNNKKRTPTCAFCVTARLETRLEIRQKNAKTVENPPARCHNTLLYKHKVQHHSVRTIECAWIFTPKPKRALDFGTEPCRFVLFRRTEWEWGIAREGQSTLFFPSEEHILVFCLISQEARAFRSQRLPSIRFFSCPQRM